MNKDDEQWLQDFMMDVVSNNQHSSPQTQTQAQELLVDIATNKRTRSQVLQQQQQLQWQRDQPLRKPIRLDYHSTATTTPSSAVAAWFELCMDTIIERRIVGDLHYLSIKPTPLLLVLVERMSLKVQSESAGKLTSSDLCRIFTIRWREVYNHILHEYALGAYGQLVTEVDGVLCSTFSANPLHRFAAPGNCDVNRSCRAFEALVENLDTDCANVHELALLPLTFHHHERIANCVMKTLVQLKNVLRVFAQHAAGRAEGEQKDDDKGTSLEDIRNYLQHFEAKRTQGIMVRELFDALTKPWCLSELLDQVTDMSTCVPQLWLYLACSDDVRQELFEHAEDPEDHAGPVCVELNRNWDITIDQLLSCEDYWPLFRLWHIRPSNFSSLHQERVCGLSALDYCEDVERTCRTLPICKTLIASVFPELGIPEVDTLSTVLDHMACVLNMKWLVEVRGITHYVNMKWPSAHVLWGPNENRIWDNVCKHNRDVGCGFEPWSDDDIAQCKKNYFDWRTPDSIEQVERLFPQWEKLLSTIRSSPDAELAIHCSAGQGRTGIMLLRALLLKYPNLSLAATCDLLSFWYRPQSTKEVLAEDKKMAEKDETPGGVHVMLQCDPLTSELREAMDAQQTSLWRFLTDAAWNNDQE